MSQPTSSPGPRTERSGGCRALVVDDERALADPVGTYLTRDGFEVSLAHDGQQAVEAARQLDPDVMVLDLGLPVLDGVEVCRERAYRPRHRLPDERRRMSQPVVRSVQERAARDRSGSTCQNQLPSMREWRP